MSHPQETIEQLPPAVVRHGRPIHVAHLMMTFQTGGLERLVYALARRTASLGVTTTVLAYGEDGEMREQFEDAGIPAIFVPTDGGIQVRLGPQLAFELAARRVDVLHTHHLGPFVYGTIAAGLAQIPHVTTEHSRELYDTPRRRLIGRNMSRAARVVTVSHELAAWRAANFDDTPEVIVNGVDVPPKAAPPMRAERQRALGLRGDFVVACVARFSPEKDHATLIRAFRRVVNRCPSAELLLMGWGPLEATINEQVTALGLQDNVFNLGQRDDVESVLQACHAMALTSSREGLPLALLEGMAASLPIVATSVGDIPTLVEDGEGVVCPVGDDAAIAAALVRFAEDDRARRRAGNRARSLVRRRHSLDATAREYVAVYDSVLDDVVLPVERAVDSERVAEKVPTPRR